MVAGRMTEAISPQHPPVGLDKLVFGHARFTYMFSMHSNQNATREWLVGTAADAACDAVPVRARDWRQALDIGVELLGVERERLVVVPRGGVE